MLHANNSGVSRRSLLSGASALGVAGAFSSLLARPVRAGSLGAGAGLGYGPLSLVNDQTTGLPLIKLPSGFTYSTFGWTNSPMSNGDPTPSSHDGMAVVQGGSARVLLVRNHEKSGVGSAFPADGSTYDALAQGGTTTLGFNVRNGEWLFSRPSLSGTDRNCAGGPTPWGSWLSGEESSSSVSGGFDEEHGWVFEVPGTARASAVPLRAMGRFSHEAVAVDPKTGFIYETEDDRYSSGLYRFRPNKPNVVFGLEAGGALEMLKVVGVQNADLQQAQVGDTHQVEWVQIDDPELPTQSGVGPFGSFDGSTTSASGPFVQGYAAGGAQFRRLEGIWYDGDGKFYFVDTEGGRPASDTGEPEGTVWVYDPASETIRVVFESPAEATLDNPDNLAISPRGGIILCEDGDRDGLRLKGLSPAGDLFEFAENAVMLNGEMGFTGDFSGSEWAGATFDFTGRWLFVNIQTPGITLAITGPWEKGGL